MDLRMLSLCALLLAICTSVQSQFPNGATVNECGSLAPAGSTNSTLPVPFIIASLVQRYEPGGDPITVVFASQQAGVFAEGLVLQARRGPANTDSTPVGSFALPGDGNYRLLQCGTSTDGTITNINDNPKPLAIIFMWTPPAINEGPIQFIGSLSNPTNQFWARQLSTSPLQSTAGELGPVTIGVCPVASVNNFVATWTAPSCSRGNTQVQESVATCLPPSGSTFPVGTSNSDCTCSDRGESAVCQIPVNVVPPADACGSNPCQNGGTCIATAAGFFCVCPAGLPQPTCTDVGPPADACSSNPCQNGGTCIATAAGFFCVCPAGLPQPTCTDVGPPADACSSNPCQNGGTCIATTAGFFCQCPAGLAQPTCTGGACDGNPCAGNECRESASSMAGYTCHSITGTPCQQL